MDERPATVRDLFDAEYVAMVRLATVITGDVGVAEEITQEAFAREIGTCPVWFRPPHGQRTPMMARVVKDHRMRMAMWDVSVSDRGTNDPRAIANKVLESVRGGSIIDLHAGLDGTSRAHRAAVIAALPLILDGLHALNLRPVRLDTLVGGPAYQSCANPHS